MTDYKFLVLAVNRALFRSIKRGTKDQTLDFYDTDWNRTAIRRKTRTSDDILPRPERLDEMIHISRKLSRNDIHVRIDLYEVNGRVYFGEKTYFSASGLKPFLHHQHDLLLGSWIDLPLE